MDQDPVRILLVEDTEGHVGLIRHALRSGTLRMELSVAKTLQEARAHLAQSTPDLLILDLQLPDGRGMELFPSDGTQLPFPVIVSTAHGEQRDAVEAMKAGAMDYLVKSSATLAEMHRVVERTLCQWGHIVERQKAEEALRESERRYRDIANHIPGVVFQFLLHCDGSVELPFVSQRVVDLLGISAQELQQDGSLLLDILAAEEHDAMVDTIRTSAGDRTSFEHEFQLKTKAGNTKWIRIAASTRTLPSGTILLNGAVTDITDRKRIAESLQKAHDQLETRVRQRTTELTAVNRRLREEIEDRKRVEQTLRESETRLNATIENLPFDFFTLDEDGRYDRQNSHCRRKWGNIVGKRPEEVAPDDKCLTLWLDNNRRAFSGERIEGEVEYELGGKKMTCYNILVPIRDNGCVRGILGMNIDITKRKRAEQQAQQRLAELAHIGRLNTMGGMIAELAHEINQPLFAITNYASACQELLAARDNEDFGAIPDWLEKIARQAYRTGEIIRRLNRFIRKTQPQQSTANINDLVADVAELMESTARLYRVEIQVRFGGSLPSLLMDRIQIEQVIANLVQNAIDAMREIPTEQRRLTVETSISANNEIRVAVRDAGKGITQEELDRVFDAFYTTKEDGMGMGLAICRSIVEDHDGRLQATRNPDCGTTFSFTLPVRMQQESEYVRRADGVYRG